MATMNGAATRIAPAAAPSQWEPPLDLHARSWTEEHARSVFHARKWRTQGGLARQSAYAIIDVLLVCTNAFVIYGLRFGFSSFWSAGGDNEAGDWPHLRAGLPQFSDPVLFADCPGLPEPGSLPDTARVDGLRGIKPRGQGRRPRDRAPGAVHLHFGRQGNFQAH